jgi:hypothetical protein
VHLVVVFVHGRGGIDADVEGLVPPRADRQALRHGMAVHGVAVNLQGARAALAEARIEILIRQTVWRTPFSICRTIAEHLKLKKLDAKSRR